MNKRIFVIIVTSVIGIFTILGYTNYSDAADNGGVIQTNGNLGFYEGDSSSTVESSSSTTESSSSTSTTTSSKAVVTKPVGKFPSTGELVKQSLSVAGVVLMIIVAFLFFWKKKNKKEVSGEEK